MRVLRSAAPSIRARLTLWYALALTAMMIVYATATYVAVRHEFLEQLNDQLYDDVEVAKQRLIRTADDTWGGSAIIPAPMVSRCMRCGLRPVNTFIVLARRLL